MSLLNCLSFEEYLQIIKLKFIQQSCYYPCTESYNKHFCFASNWTMDSILPPDNIEEPFGNTVMNYAACSIKYATGLIHLSIYTLHYKKLLNAFNSLKDIHRTLHSQPKLFRSLLMVLIAFLWPLPFFCVKFDKYNPIIATGLVTIKVQICFFCSLVEEAFKVLKNTVKDNYKPILPMAEDGAMLLYFDEPCMKNGHGPSVNLYRLRRVHRQLYDVMSLVNEAYGLAALLVTFTWHCFFTLFLYCWIISDFQNTYIIFASIELLTITFFCYKFEALKKVEKEMSDLINGFDKSSLDAKTQAELKLFFIQLRSHKLIFSPFQMFELGFGLVIDMFTTTVTCLMLLKQFN